MFFKWAKNPHRNRKFSMYCDVPENKLCYCRTWLVHSYNKFVSVRNYICLGSYNGPESACWEPLYRLLYIYTYIAYMMRIIVSLRPIRVCVCASWTHTVCPLEVKGCWVKTAVVVLGSIAVNNPQNAAETQPSQRAVGVVVWRDTGVETNTDKRQHRKSTTNNRWRVWHEQQAWDLTRSYRERDLNTVEVTSYSRWRPEVSRK